MIHDALQNAFADREMANKQWGKALIVTDGQLVKLGLLDSLFSALDEHQMSYHLFDEV
ncbi:hypothetical protein MJL79_28850, partial [Salmonella enterica subsp. enterica serovar Montevideo]|nr:hypothetical protein [Salmonella enterica subsp. enterica serovar Montevideo]